MKISLLVTLLASPALIIAAQLSDAQTTSPDHSASTNPASRAIAEDNTKSNKDPSNRNDTADQQKNDASDLELAQRIRQSIVADKSLSTYAHNVKVVAVNGTVTLNGVVRSADERAQIARKSASIAGADHVVNVLKIEAPR